MKNIIRILHCRWIQASIPIGMVDKPFIVEFQAKQGAADNGYIALDDIRLLHCNPGTVTNLLETSMIVSIFLRSLAPSKS